MEIQTKAEFEILMFRKSEISRWMVKGSKVKPGPGATLLEKLLSFLLYDLRH